MESNDIGPDEFARRLKKFMSLEPDYSNPRVRAVILRLHQIFSRHDIR